MRTLLTVLMLLVCVQTQAASLRTMTTLHGPNVYLRDLFDDAGSNADRVLGPGPDPGGRIVVEAPQLNAIARQFNVALAFGVARRPRRVGMAGSSDAKGGRHRGRAGGDHRQRCPR